MGKMEIDLNCDLGETFGANHAQVDRRLMKFISSANIACGYHAGDPVEMHRTVQHADSFGVSCGAHPGYPDLLGFGRREMNVTQEELRSYLVYQIGALAAICRANRKRLSHVKMHGSLYLKAVEDGITAKTIAQTISHINTNLTYIVLGGKGGREMAHWGEYYGLSIAFEGYPNRAYTSAGTLLPREKEGAVITEADEIIRRSLMMVLEKRVLSTEGIYLEQKVDTIHIPGETPNAIEVAKTIRKELLANGVHIRSLDKQTRHREEA